MAESITITDNRTGEPLEIPIVNGGVAATEWSKLLPGIWFYDPAFMSTAACESADHLPRRRRRDPALPRATPSSSWPSSRPTSRWPTCCLHGELPTTEQFEAWRHEITYHTFIHENVRKRFLEGFHYDAHPMGMLVSAVAALSTFYLDAKEIFDPDVARQADHPADRQDADPGRGRPPLQRGHALRLPGQLARLLPANFLSMMWKVAEPRFEADPVLARALDVLFILHADHEQNCSTTAMRVVGSSHADPYSACAAAGAALYGPRHGGANEAVIRMLTEIGSIDNVPAFIDGGQGRQRPAAGLRPPGLQELRPAGQDHQADGRRGVRGHRQEPAARHRPQARGDRPLATSTSPRASSTRTSTSTRASSTRPWASRSRCSRSSSPSRGPSGWLAHWQELLDQDSKIARPRQLYIGADERRDYVPIAGR